MVKEGEKERRGRVNWREGNIGTHQEYFVNNFIRGVFYMKILEGSAIYKISQC